MSVYPFYVEANAEGRRSPIAGGTRRKDGDMTVEIYQRSKGAITNPYTIRQYSTYPMNEASGEREHKLVTDVYYQGEVIHSHITDY